MKKVIVLSLGGSLIIPGEVNTNYLKKFKKVILKHKKKYNFIIVTGGGSIARKYIKSLNSIGMNKDFQSFSGISATRMNARFMTYFFGFDQEYGIPHTIGDLKRYLIKKDIIFCGALEYKPNQTSDSTAAEIAREFKAEFINLTNVDGLFDKNPKEHPNAKLIKSISWNEFDEIASKISFKPGQHFVLDQKASKIILKERIKTYIIGDKIKNLDLLLSGKNFKGTIINN